MIDGRPSSIVLIRLYTKIVDWKIWKTEDPGSLLVRTENAQESRFCRCVSIGVVQVGWDGFQPRGVGN